MISLLESRGLIAQITASDLEELTREPIVVYAGFDPSSDSLHLGNLVGLIALGWFSRRGHTTIALIGGGTGMIGDPSGKSQERVLLDEEAVLRNVLGVERSIRQVLERVGGEGRLIFQNNADWLSKISLIDFLRDYGKHFRVSTMLAKDSVRERLGSEEGISFTEFSYQALQGFDFLHLCRMHKATLQIGGSDQWGNITAGCELIRKIEQKSAWGLTWPLLLRSDGKKFGKTESGAVWLNPDKLSVFEFYQYLVRTPDADVIKMMRMLTFMDLEEIATLERDMQSSTYRANSAQRRLADEITWIVHGEEGVALAQRVTKAAMPGETTELTLDALQILSQEAPSTPLAKEQLFGRALLDLLVHVGLCHSKGEARRLITGGGAYLNNERIDDLERKISENDLIEQRFLLLAAGKKQKRVIQLF